MTDIWHIIPTFQITGQAEDSPEVSPYKMQGSTAIIPIIGPTSKFGGWATTSTMNIRRQVRAAANDDAVESVMLYVDSPGGTVAGNRDFARDVRSLANEKPTYAYASDLMASAAYGVASQAGRIFSNENAMIGSIGTMSALFDTSELAKKLGVKVHSVTSGGVKGMGVFGTEITPEQVAYWQGLVNKMGDQFVESVATGRNISMTRARQLADGRLHIAADAANLGLIDGVATLEASIADLQKFSSSTRERVFAMYPNKGSNDPSGLATPMPQNQQPSLFPISSDGSLGQGVQHPMTPQPQAAQPQQQPSQPQQPAAQPQQPVLTATVQPVQQLVETATLQPTAATIQEIEAACPGASAEFVLSQFKAGVTVQAAQTAFIASQSDEINRLKHAPTQPQQPQQPQSGMTAQHLMQTPTASVVGGQPVVPQPEEHVPEEFGGNAEGFFESELAKEEAYLRDYMKRDPHEVHKQAVFNVYKRNPGLREKRMENFDPRPVKAPAPSRT